jgi:hypothetical protein
MALTVKSLLHSFAELKTVSYKLVSTSLAICNNLTKDISKVGNAHQCMNRGQKQPSVTSSSEKSLWHELTTNNLQALPPATWVWLLVVRVYERVRVRGHH